MTQSWKLGLASSFYNLEVLKCPVGEAPRYGFRTSLVTRGWLKVYVRVILLSVCAYHEGIVNSVLRSMFNHGIKAH